MEQLLLVNPSKRRGRGRKTKAKRSRARRTGHRSHTIRVHKNPIRSRRHRRSIRFHRNPISGGARGLMRTVTGTAVDGAIGAAGGIAVDAMLKLVPVSMKTGPMGHLVRGAGAIVLGLVGGIAKIPAAGKLATGAMTIALYNAAREYVTVPMGLGEYTDSDIAELAGLSGALGYDDTAALENGGANVGEFVTNNDMIYN